MSTRKKEEAAIDALIAMALHPRSKEITAKVHEKMEEFYKTDTAAPDRPSLPMKTPLKVRSHSENQRTHDIEDSDRNGVGIGIWPEDAAYIVLCVNQHEALEQRCARLESILGRIVRNDAVGCDNYKAISDARAVLSETKEGK